MTNKSISCDTNEISSRVNSREREKEREGAGEERECV